MESVLQDIGGPLHTGDLQYCRFVALAMTYTKLSESRSRVPSAPWVYVGEASMSTANIRVAMQYARNI